MWKTLRAMIWRPKYHMVQNCRYTRFLVPAELYLNCIMLTLSTNILEYHHIAPSRPLTSIPTTISHRRPHIIPPPEPDHRTAVHIPWIRIASVSQISYAAVYCSYTTKPILSPPILHILPTTQHSKDRASNDAATAHPYYFYAPISFLTQKTSLSVLYVP